MGKQQLLAAVKRTPWRSVGSQILSRAGFALTLGQDQSLSLAATIPDSDPKFTALERLLKEALTVSEKSVRLYKLSDAESTVVSSWIASKRRTTNALTQAYPGVAPENVVRSNASTDLVSLGSQRLEVGEAALFTGVRQFLERTQIPLSDLKHRGDFENVYGQKKVFWQTFDCLWLPGIRYQRSQVLVSVADDPHKAPQDFALRSHDAMVTELRHSTGVRVKPVNLFNAVQNLHDSREGHLTLNGFINNADAVKYHRGRRDLRRDAYDQAGARAVGTALQPFRVGVKWSLTANDGSVRSTPTLALLGTSRILAKPSPTIESAVVGNCIDSNDLKFVIERLVQNL